MARCPLRHGTTLESNECIKGECAWWFMGDCCIVSIAGILEEKKWKNNNHNNQEEMR